MVTESNTSAVKAPSTNGYTWMMVLFISLASAAVGGMIESEVDAHNAIADATISSETPLPRASPPRVTACPSLPAPTHDIQLPPRTQLVVNGTVVVPGTLNTRDLSAYLGRFHFHRSPIEASTQ